MRETKREDQSPIMRRYRPTSVRDMINPRLPTIQKSQTEQTKNYSTSTSVIARVYICVVPNIQPGTTYPPSNSIWEINPWNQDFLQTWKVRTGGLPLRKQCSYLPEKLNFIIMEPAPY